LLGPEDEGTVIVGIVVTIYQSKQRDFPEDLNVQQRRFGNLISRIQEC
jgi:hypothetical protein